MGNIRGLARPAYTGVRLYMQPAGYRFMSNVPKSTVPLSLQTAVLRSQAMPAISTMQTPQRQFGAEVWGPVLVGAGAGWFGRSLYNRLSNSFNQYWNKPVTPVAPVFVQPSGLQPQEVETEAETHRITASLLSVLKPAREQVKICPIKTINELFDPQKAVQVAQLRGAASFIGLIKNAIKKVNEDVSSKEVIIPNRVLEALDLLSVYPELKAEINEYLMDDMNNFEYLRENDAMTNIDSKSRTWTHDYYTKKIEQIKAIQKALNR